MISVTFLLAALVVLVAARPQLPPQQQTTPIPIIRSSQDTGFDGGYAFSYETGNSITRDEVSQVVNPGAENELRTVKGSYAYVDPDGNPVEVRYFVDESGGFQVESAVLPVAPEIPQEIQEALAKNAAEEAQLSEAERAEVESGRYIASIYNRF